MAASTSAAAFLREAELRLLRCTLPTAASKQPPPSPPPAHPLGPVAASAVAAVELGDYAAALAAAAPHILHASASASNESADSSPAQFYAELAAAVEAFLRGDGEGAADEVFECRCALVLSAAVAALLAFTQQNVTGPPGKYSPFPFWTSSLEERWYSDPGGRWDAWASDHLASFGSHVHGKFSLLQFIVFAEILFASMMSLDSSGFRTAYLEGGIADYKYGRVDASRLHLDSAQDACGIHLSLTGILGFRTIHQVDAKSQMVLVAKISEPELKGSQSDVIDFRSTRSSIPTESDEFCDILRTPRLAQNGNNSSGESMTCASTQISLTPIQQAAVLAECLHVNRRSRNDEMSGWEMAPYIESIESQDESYFVVKSLGDVLRTRWESTRSHTKQRALFMMENLIEDIIKECPVASQRAKLVFGVHMPSLPALRKEYGELLISCGILGKALDVFKDLELWDNLIYCYQLSGKLADAVSLINARLSVTPNDPRLWCSLGDASNNDDHYRKALEVSNNKSARALRSLARSAYNRNDLDTSKTLWESALALNSLHPDGWFAYGIVLWKDKDLEKAVDAFTHAVQIDPENGEAWNNLACLHMIRGKS
uniref:Uncharacterized protein n=1 Tax=Avena sativa TaxID=4498 RepID=A0ACD5TUF3_AVESA